MSVTAISECDDASVSSGYEAYVEELANEASATMLQVASLLTDPICKAHEYYRRLHVGDELHPSVCKASILGYRLLLCMGLLGWANLALYTTIPGIGLRYAVNKLKKEPYIHVRGNAPIKNLQQRTFSLLSWNVCCVGAGYPISDGGVTPWCDRIDAIVQKILQKDADVNCLYETFDTKSAQIIIKRLKEKGYNDFYYVISGPKPVGVSSGMLVASKYKIIHPQFTPFPEEALVGRTKNAAKGVFSFSLQDSQGTLFADVHTTHLQHSEEPEYPTPEETTARQLEMKIIAQKIGQVRDRCIVFTGDLNMDDKELTQNLEAMRTQIQFEKGDLFDSSKKTWGGDEFCAKLVGGGKKVSGPLNLDHTLVVQGTAQSIRTELMEVGFDHRVFKKKALSDHSGLYSVITV